MALHRKTFQTRTLTAIIFAAVMLVGLLWNEWSFLVLFSIIHFGCWWEFFNLLERIYNTPYHRLTRLGLMLVGYSFMLWLYHPSYQISPRLIQQFSFLVSIAGIVLLTIGVFQTRNIKLKPLGFSLLGLLYISLSCGLMMNMKRFGSIDIGIHEKEIFIGFFFIPLIIVASIWINDTMAYIVGSLIGKTPLSKISPKKTWEGTIGGIILSIGLIVLIFTKVHPGPPGDPSFYIFYGVIAAISSIFGTLGDLLESKLKRMAGVKDSGNIMPGHGGFLDRFDSLLLATPGVWLYVYGLHTVGIMHM